MFDPITAATLANAGWFDGRSVDVGHWTEVLRAEGIEVHEPGRAFLAEFGGLSVEQSGWGVSRAREPFAFDPDLCIGEGDRFLEWSHEIDRRIVPVGELDHGRFFLGLDEASELYSVEMEVATFGRMPTAMERLVLGFMPVEVEKPHES